MLVMADGKAKETGSEIHWRHGKAESTGLAANSFDLVTASLLFHELPPSASQAVIKEAFRLLLPGGQIVILDGNQRTLRHTEWLTEVFEEPYIKDYARSSTDAWLGRAGFEAVQTEELWWIHQLTQGLKPLLANSPRSATVTWEAERSDLDAMPAPV